MKPDIVYVLRDYSNSEDSWELVYSLRSMNRNLSDFGKVWVVTNNFPDFLNPDEVGHIPSKDTYPKEEKDKNIMKKILAACDDRRVSPDFLFVNDDHMLLSPCRAGAIPPYNKGDLRFSTNNSSYGYQILDTAEVLMEHGFKTVFFDIHTPIIYEKSKFIEMSNFFPWKDAENAFIIKSLYGNFHRIPTQFRMKDLKVYKQHDLETLRNMVKGRQWMSTDERARGPAMFDLLDEYCGSEPCRFERAFRL